MKKWKKIGKGFTPFLLAIACMYVVTILVLIAAGALWGVLHYGQLAQDSAAASGFYTDEAWIRKVSIWVSITVYLVFLLIFGLWYKKAFWKGSNKGKGRLTVIEWISCFVFGVSIQYFFSSALQLLLPLFPSINESYRELLNKMGMGQGVLPFFYMALLAPVAEELIFRGLILRYEEQVLPYFAANLIQAFLFGVYHQNIVQFVYAFLVGLLLGCLCKRYESLFVAMLVHAVVNASGNVISYFHALDWLEGVTKCAVTACSSLVIMAFSFWILMRKKQMD